MVTEITSLEKLESQSKIEQTCTNLHANVVAADIIRTAEIRMQQRGMLPGGQVLSHNPFWFLVETEKNVFLWRSGATLADKDKFDFWVDIESLLNKRISQLERQNNTNPAESVFEDFELSVDPTKAEKEYLEALRETIMPILNHLSALSEVQREIIAENTASAGQRVVLPFSK